MEPKKYQQAVLNDLVLFLEQLDKTGDVSEAYLSFWGAKGVPVGFGNMPPYQRIIKDVPNVCFKVPTGGGKTFMAACALKPIFDYLPYTKTKAVVWIVPSDAILSQTEQNLSDPNHPYRQRINADFSHRVEVYTKSQLLSGQNFNPTVVNEQLSIFVLSYDSFRTAKKVDRKVYSENGNLALFSDFIRESSVLLDNVDDTALIQVIRSFNPVLIVDESHHARTDLSKEMLTNFNPCFVLDLTATPREESNIISYVEALQLKNENMVKLPVILYNRPTEEDVYSDAIRVRRKLEKIAERDRMKVGSRYIRPIVLFQAPSKGKSNTTFEMLKENLIALGIDESHIAIKTSHKNELRGVDLLSKDCPIRYIITINALNEGWDCPFAYVLATVANRSSPIEVEQILGRILRLPYASKCESDELNISYVITHSKDFAGTVGRVIEGLNNAGFTDEEYREGTLASNEGVNTTFTGVQTKLTPHDDYVDDIPVNIEKIKEKLKEHEYEQTELIDDNILAAALEMATEYNKIVQKFDVENSAPVPMALKSYVRTTRMNEAFEKQVSELRLPQFVIPKKPSIFADRGTTLLSEEELTEGFSLLKESPDIDFSVIEDCVD